MKKSTDRRGTGKTGLSDIEIEGYRYPTPIESPAITISAIERAVETAAPNKALGINRITNDVLHAVLDILMPCLCKLLNACLALGWCPADLKETITVIPRKLGKNDYS